MTYVTQEIALMDPKKKIHKANPQVQGPSKTFQQDGHWIEKPNKTPILVCACGNRYLKTRAGQAKCLRCLSTGRR